MNAKRKKVEAYLFKVLDDIDSTGANSKLYRTMFKKMSDTKFDQLMKKIRDGETRLFIMLPNMKNDLTMNDIVELAKKYAVDLYERVYLSDSQTGREYLTNKTYLILNLPVRRVKQYLFNKISLPESDSNVNLLTGQVINEDKGAKITDVETKILANKGLDTTLVELLKMRGGDTSLYQEAKRQIEETGDVSWEDLDINSMTKSVVIAGMFLEALMLEHNLGG